MASSSLSFADARLRLIPRDLVTGETEPYFVAYHFVTNRDRATETFSRTEGFFKKYIFKPQPLTRGDYRIEITPPAEIKICRVLITHVGYNMPCTEPPGPSETGFENTKIVYAGGVEANARQCGSEAEVFFKVIFTKPS